MSLIAKFGQQESWGGEIKTFENNQQLKKHLILAAQCVKGALLRWEVISSIPAQVSSASFILLFRVLAGINPFQYSLIYNFRYYFFVVVANI